MYFIIQWFRWRKWKKKAVEAMENCTTVQCAICFDHIFPGDFVGVCASEEFVHAGYHFTLTEQNAFCETGGIGVGHWNGEFVEGVLEAVVEKAFRTGETQIGTY